MTYAMAASPLGETYSTCIKTDGVLVGQNETEGSLQKAKTKRMKRIGGLWEQVIAIDNLRMAGKKATKGKQWKAEVQEYKAHEEERVMTLHKMLKEKTFTTSPYRKRKIKQKKERELKILPLWPDKVVHHAVMLVLEEIWTKTFTHNTHSCIEDRGIEACAKQVVKVIRKHEGRPLYCLKCDIEKFYQNIDHDVLKKIVRKKIKDKDVLWVLDDIIDSTEGMPIGNYPSPWFANLLLSYMMHWINEDLAREVQEEMGLAEKPSLDVIEYADDIVLFGDSKKVMWEAWKRIRVYVEGRLKLKIKGNWQLFPVAENRQDKHGRSVDYVGYQFFRNQRLMRKSIKVRMCREAAKLNHRKNITDKEYKIGLAPWLGWAKHSDSKNLLRTIIKNQKVYESLLF